MENVKQQKKGEKTIRIRNNGIGKNVHVWSSRDKEANNNTDRRWNEMLINENEQGEKGIWTQMKNRHTENANESWQRIRTCSGWTRTGIWC